MTNASDQNTYYCRNMVK